MNRIRTTAYTATATILGSLAAFPALAGSPIDYWNAVSGSLGNSGLPQQSVVTTTVNLISGFLSIIGIIALILIIYGGFTMMTSGGNEEKVKRGRDFVIWASIGALVILSSLGILQLIDSFI